MSATATPNGITAGTTVIHDGITCTVTEVIHCGLKVTLSLGYAVHYSAVRRAEVAAPTRREIRCYDKVVHQGQTRTVVQLCEGSDGITRAMLSGGGWAVPVSELHHPGEEPPAPAAVPAVVVLPARAPLTTPAPKVRRPRRTLTPVNRRYATALLVSQPGVAHRRECFAATSKDGVWRYDREDEPGTPWFITHLPTGTVIEDTWGNLNDARYATANGSALAQVEQQIATAKADTEAARVAEQAAQVVAEAETITKTAADYTPVRRRHVARGALLDMSTTQAQAIHAAGQGGTIGRNTGPVRLTVTQLAALNDRGYVTAYAHRDSPYRIVFAIVEAFGVSRANEILKGQPMADSDPRVRGGITIRDTSGCFNPDGTKTEQAEAAAQQYRQEVAEQHGGNVFTAIYAGTGINPASD